MLKNEKDYGFYDMNGGIYLPQQTPALIFAVGEENDKIYFALQRITTQKEQTVTLTAAVVTKAELQRLLDQMGLDDVEMKVDDSKNSKEIRTVDAELERVRQIIKGCECTDGYYSEKQ